MQYTYTTPVAPSTSTTEDIDNIHRVVRDEWKHGEYTLVREVMHGKDNYVGKSRWAVDAASYELPSLQNSSDWNATPVFGVNWSAMGTKSIEESEAYAYALLNATEAAKRFNSIVESHS